MSRLIPLLLCAAMSLAPTVAVAALPPDRTGAGAVEIHQAIGTMDVESSLAGWCPGTGDCCVANYTPGCYDVACCGIVCGRHSYCCDTVWDMDCAAYAIIDCDDSACGFGCPGTGDCCSDNGSPGCEDEFCCDLVCTQEPFCCDGEWDSDCAQLARILCPGLCEPVDPCPGQGECCLANGTVGCEDVDCCHTVCGEDPFCCQGEWDSICAGIADVLCTPLCEGSCPSDGDCCLPHETPGCNDRTCCDAVCSSDAACCNDLWDADCVDLAGSLCPDLCTGWCPGEGDCCEIHSTGGCSDKDCCELVIAQDDFCGWLSWDSDCVSYATDLCGCPPLCPGPGECCEANGTAGCQDTTCCERVCADTPSCCTGTWDASCAALAESLCGATCTCPLFGDFDEDGTRSLADFSWIQRCFSGPDAGPVHPTCACADLAANDDVDLPDVKAFITLFSGP